MKKPVLTKQDFVRRYLRGEFGNASPTWELKQWLAEIGYWEEGDSETLYHLRNREAGGETFYNLSAIGLKEHMDVLDNWDNWYVSEMAPTEKTVIQGEVQNTPGGIVLTYSDIVKPMREALKERTLYTSGLRAACLLRHYLCPTSYDWLVYLLTEYLDHVVEFSTYSTCWGTLPNMNTVFWEVRKY